MNSTLSRFENFVTCNAVHPGIVNTNLYRHLHWATKILLQPIASRFFMVSFLPQIIQIPKYWYINKI